MERLKIEERLLNLRIANNKNNIKLQAELLKNKHNQEKRSIDNEILDQKTKNAFIYELNVKLVNDLKKLYRDAITEIDKKQLEGLKDQLSRLKAYQADYNQVSNRLQRRKKRCINRTSQINYFPMTIQKFVDTLDVAKEYLGKAKEIGDELIKVYQQADKIAVATGRDVTIVKNELMGIWKESEINKANYQWALTFEETIGLSVGNVAKMLQWFDDQKKDNLIKTKLDYEQRYKLQQENAIRQEILNERILKDSTDYYKRIVDLAHREYLAINENGKLSTETQEQWQKRRLDSYEKYIEAVKKLNDSYIEDSKIAGNDRFAIQNRIMKAMEDAEENFKRVIVGIYEDETLSEEDKNTKIVNARKKLNKDLRKLDNDLQKQEMKKWSNLVGYGMNYVQSLGNLLSTIASYDEQELQRKAEKGEISEEEQKKEFERIKNTQIAAATVQMLAGATGAYMQAMQAYPSPWGHILGGVEAGLALTMGAMQINQIKKQEWGDRGGSGSGASSRSVDFNTIGVNPLLDENADYAGTQDVRVVQDNTNDTDGDNRVYLVESDIWNADKRNKGRIAQTTF